MKTPFPGMDPYLEHPALWEGVHSRLIHCIANQLQPHLVPRYVASIEERVYLEETPQQRIPDVWLQKRRDSGGGVAVAERRTAAPVILEVAELEVPQHYITILDRYRDFKVVTVIELISPSNKESGSGRDAYLAKQREILASESHLVEIDLLRRGPRVSTARPAFLRDLGDFDYLGCVNRWPQRKRFELYPLRLRNPLELIAIPLASPDPDVTLDLQAALEQAYWDGRYMLRVRYDDPCHPPLGSEDQQWAWECWAAYRAAHPELFPSQAPAAPPPGEATPEKEATP
ncbi:MAG: DUF4058 family protein [Gemmataceae bacterium]|nr:DUF4058 family protein [Gemmataceae bacterium]